MDQVTVIDPLSVNITSFCGPTELRDKSGSILGVFTPAIRRYPGEPEDTLEELRAAAAEPGGYTLEEIWRELGVK